MVEILLNEPRQDILREGGLRKTNPKLEAAFKRKIGDFCSSNAGKFVTLVEAEGYSSQDDIFMRLRIPENEQKRFLNNLEKKGIVDVEKHDNKFSVKGVHRERVEEMIK